MTWGGVLIDGLLPSASGDVAGRWRHAFSVAASAPAAALPSTSISVCTHLLFCAKNIKRVGDHVTNIAETVHYLVTGQPLEEHAA
jgi:phosphate uptake regulator